MAYWQRKNTEDNRLSFRPAKKKWYKRKWAKAIWILLLLVLILTGVLLWKTDSTLKKISNGDLLSTITHNLPGAKNELKGETDGRINVLLLGLRGENLPGGGLLTDTIILASIKPSENKISMISIPRDLYVTVPGTEDKQKINAVNAYGEEKGKGQGMADMKEIVSEVTGLPVHYAVSINFEGFKQLIDSVGGIEITLSKPFEEPLQFKNEGVCDDTVFTEPTGKYQTKTKKVKSKITGQVTRTRVTATYPLCSNPNGEECGGDFKLPAGKQTLTGDQSLCYVRSRKSSSDFDRAKRQQAVIEILKAKLLSMGTLTSFDKMNGVLEALGGNVKTDMAGWEMQKLFQIYSGMNSPQIVHRVLEDSEEGLLYHPAESNGAGYILLPRGDNYDKIHDLAQNIFNLPAQSDIKIQN